MWWYVEAFVQGKRTYCGKVQSSLEEIRAAFPRSYIRGQVVTVYGRP